MDWESGLRFSVREEDWVVTANLATARILIPLIPVDVLKNQQVNTGKPDQQLGLWEGGREGGTV